MSWEVVGNQITRARAPGIKVDFSDGYQARVFPVLKVASVTAPGGQTCSLKSKEGKNHLAALCADEYTVKKFREHLGSHPAEAAGAEHPGPPDASHAPTVKKLQLVDRYV